MFSICWSVTTTATLARARVRPLPARVERAQHAGEVLAAVELGPRSHDVEHAPDAARLPGMREVEADALEPGIRLDERPQLAQVHLENVPVEARRRPGADVVDLGPLEGELHGDPPERASVRRLDSRDRLVGMSRIGHQAPRPAVHEQIKLF